MRQKLIVLKSYLPWLVLLLLVDGFAAFLIWLADVKAFRVLLLTIVLATVLLFFIVCTALLVRERRIRHIFLSYLQNPGEYEEESLLRVADSLSREYIRRIGEVLRETQKQNKELLEKLEDYEEYVEVWAHEVKTPLSLLILLLDNRREEMPEQVGVKLDYIHNRIQEEVDQILFYARLKGGRKDYLFEPVSLKNCVEDVLEDYRPLLAEKKFQIQPLLTDVIVYTDRRGIRFLLGQLVSNSIKYCKETPQLEFACAGDESQQVLSVKDNGQGVRQCDLPYVFEKGFTGDSGDRGKKATGMGLYLAHEMAKQLNISLLAESERGKGFEVQIIFPVV